MNIIFQVIQMLILLIVGTKTAQPVNDLHKKPTREDHLKKWNCIFQKYYYLFIALFLLGIFIVFVAVCIAFVGASGVESGVYYNHLQEVI